MLHSMIHFSCGDIYTMFGSRHLEGKEKKTIFSYFPHQSTKVGGIRFSLLLVQFNFSFSFPSTFLSFPL
ncbi:unnamed protein product [Cuscuta campestris]|uniref:Uncharacterized protein n=1 Tax=Cuscuta campestris TaxID=132261 RepID=A0A484LK00_9ASTE|nr:unnamed protein product [Cuscuta campestris]